MREKSLEKVEQSLSQSEEDRDSLGDKEQFKEKRLDKTTKDDTIEGDDDNGGDEDKAGSGEEGKYKSILERFARERYNYPAPQKKLAKLI